MLDHIGSNHRLIHFGQKLLERGTLRTVGDYQTRRPFQHVRDLGFVIERQERLKAGTVERVFAIKPASDAE